MRVINYQQWKMGKTKAMDKMGVMESSGDVEPGRFVGSWKVIESNA